MLDLGFLDVVIGLFFVYLVIALVVTVLNELVAQTLRLRANTLKDGLAQLLDEAGVIPQAGDGGGKRTSGGLRQLLRTLGFRSVFPDSGAKTELLLHHPLIRQLGNHPSYIPASLFARAVAENLREAAAEVRLLPPSEINRATAKPRELVEAVSASEVGTIALAAPFRGLIDDASQSIEDFERLVADSFDATMERVSGWYKRRIQGFTLVFSLLIVGLLNADTIQVLDHLQTDAAAREMLVARANGLPPSGETPEFTDAYDDLRQARLTFGWVGPSPSIDDTREAPVSASGWLYKVVGLVLTGLAVSLGAPFWFDTLNRVTRIRSSGKPQRAR